MHLSKLLDYMAHIVVRCKKKLAVSGIAAINPFDELVLFPICLTWKKPISGVQEICERSA